MAKKHILDVDEQTWRDIKRFKLDFLDDRGNLNDALVLLLKRGLVRSVEARMMAQEEQHKPVSIPLQDAERVTDQVVIKEGPSVTTYEQLPKKGGKTPSRHDHWSPEKLEKMKKEMAEKFGLDLKAQQAS